MKTDDSAPPTEAPDGVATEPPIGRPWRWSAERPGEVFAAADFRAAARVALGVAVLGVPVGLLWAVLSPQATVVLTRAGVVLADQRQEVYVGADGTLALLGLVTGVVVGAAGYLWRRRRGPWMAVGVAVGSLAAGYVAWKTGHRVAVLGYERAVENAAIGDRFRRPVDLRAQGVLFVQPLVAVIVYVLAAGWSRYDDLGRVSSRSEVPAAPPAAPAPPPAGGASSPPA